MKEGHDLGALAAPVAFRPFVDAEHPRFGQSVKLVRVGVPGPGVAMCPLGLLGEDAEPARAFGTVGRGADGAVAPAEDGVGCDRQAEVVGRALQVLSHPDAEAAVRLGDVVGTGGRHGMMWRR